MENTQDKWKWSKAQLNNIDQWQTKNLRDVYFAIFGKFVSENLIKRDLRIFQGLKYTEEDKFNHASNLAKELGHNALIHICEFLEIRIDVNTTSSDMASKIVDAICYSCDDNNGSNATVESEVTVLDKVGAVDAENVQVQTDLYNKTKEIITLEQQVQDHTSDDQMMKQLNAKLELAKLELNILKAKSDALVSKKEILNTKAKLIRNSSACSAKSQISVSSKSDRVSHWVNSQAQAAAVPPEQPATRNEGNLQATIANMLARQTLNNKQIEFDGSSPLAWRNFVAQFNASSRDCGFTGEEDVHRLSKSLKGAAREKVEILLISAREPSKIISVLDGIYGGSENIALELVAKVQKVKHVRELADFHEYNCVVQNVSAALEFMECKTIDTQKLMGLFIGKLSEVFMMDWGEFLSGKGIRATDCEFHIFADWCQKQTNIVQDVDFFKKIREINSCVSTNAQESKMHSEEKVKNKSACPLWSLDRHAFDKCSIFLKNDVKKRWDLANKHKACYCCLKFHKGQCSQREMCQIDKCEKYHHRLLHKRKLELSAKTSNFNGCIVETKKTVILKMVPVAVHGPAGIKNVIAFLDEGSTSTIMDMSIAKEIGIQGKSKPFCFSWTGDIFRHESNAEIANITISNGKNKMHTLNDVHLINDLNLPKQQIDYEDLLQRFPYVSMANLPDDKQKPMLLIGQQHANLITSQTHIKADNNGPLISKTKLGWVLHGPVEAKIGGSDFVCCQVEDSKLDEMLKNAYSLDSFGVCINKIDKTKSAEEQLAIERINSSIIKLNGRFEVNLPFRKLDVVLPDSKPMAIQRLKCLERKLLRNNSMAEAYQLEIDKLLKRGYARELPNTDILKSPKLWYLPHFAVVNPNKPEKVRLVFDAAAECNGTSLNKNLLTGPDWLTSIVGILLRFRLNSIAYAADIKEMFNQISISDEDTAAQCFLWRNLDTNAEPTVYQMKAMLFGTSSSPFIAQFVKNHNALMYESQNQDAVNSILENHYVDDVLESKSTVDEAVKTILDVIDIHLKGGFEIRNFISNSKEVLQQIPMELHSDKATTYLNDKTDLNQKVLGMIWDAKSDVLSYSVKTMHRISSSILDGSVLPTKRKVLSAVNSIYDPLGLITPIVLKGRILMREIWQSGIHWDDVIKDDMAKKWFEWLKDVKSLDQVVIPRCYSHNIAIADSIELHIFCDASSKAYAAAAYIRLCYQENKRHAFDVALIASKARVSPIKQMTIPKLETQAAVLGCRLAETIQKELKIKFGKRYFWTDSRTTLSWINSNERLQTFIAHRISEISEKSEITEWNWVPTAINIADIITRDKATVENWDRWLIGPLFLYESVEFWPKQVTSTEHLEIVEKVMLVNYVELSISILAKICSSYTKVLRTTGWIKRFVHNTTAGKQNIQKREGDLQVDELQWATTIWCKIVQHECFANDRQYVETGRKHQNLRLTKFCLYIDENKLLRIAARTKHESNAESTKPIVLDGTHNFTKLLVQDLHIQANHIGIQVVVHKFKEKYWMPKMTQNIKKIINTCSFCKRKKATPIQPIMGLLPKERFTTHQKPFTAAGVDYFGPYFVKIARGVGGRYSKDFRKRYGVLFTCLTTRAIHVEVANSLSTDSCIMAIRRMMARRGEIKVLWSDNGTNFRGASSELLKALEELDEQAVESTLANRGIQWNFIPACAPNFGGSWERLIGCFKRALEAALPTSANVSDESLRTIFCEAEHLVNSRPYILESDDPDDDISLCPNDILMQQTIAIHAPSKPEEFKSTEKRMWRITQSIIDSFWRRFIKEYIPMLINRSKWIKNVENLKEGEIVLMKGNSPRAEWPLGIVVNVYPGEDGIVRVVDVRASSKTYRRPVNGLYKLGVCASNIGDRAETGTQH